jgi:hypothetical protein
LNFIIHELNSSHRPRSTGGHSEKAINPRVATAPRTPGTLKNGWEYYRGKVIEWLRVHTILNTKNHFMKNLFLLALVACFGFIACDTPSPATSSPADSTGTTIQSAPDTLRSGTGGTDTTSSGTQRSDTTRRDSSGTR